MKAYVLINACSGSVETLVSTLTRFEGVRRASACCGKPDIFVEAVIDRIRRLGSVESRLRAFKFSNYIVRPPSSPGVALPGTQGTPDSRPSGASGDEPSI
jgi:hypothetical protein